MHILLEKVHWASCPVSRSWVFRFHNSIVSEPVGRPLLGTASSYRPSTAFMTLSGLRNQSKSGFHGDRDGQA
jgi:hypothetical protein